MRLLPSKPDVEPTWLAVVLAAVFASGKVFGPNAKLTRATLEIVSARIWPLNAFGIMGEPITMGIEKRLPWIPDHYDIKLDGQRCEVSAAELKLATSLASGAFKAGL